MTTPALTLRDHVPAGARPVSLASAATVMRRVGSSKKVAMRRALRTEPDRRQVSGRRRGRAWTAVIAALAAIALGTGLAPLPARAATGDVGYQDASFSGTGTPTGTKRAESVLWWNDGSWWADMWDTVSQDFNIFRLDTSTQTWVDTHVLVDPRANTHADALWDGATGKLYVASHLFVADGSAAVAGGPSNVYRYSYDPLARTYSLDAGFPQVVNRENTETLVIDKDSTGKLWATWQQGNQIFVNRTTSRDQSWGVPFALPASGSAVTVDDNSAVLAFGGSRIGVMWSNQTTAADAMYFAVHEDGQADGTWQASRTAIQGPGSADDHINLKSLQSDGSGRVFAAVKTSFTASSSPLIMLLVRDPATGSWSSYPIARVSDCPNRPIVVIDEQAQTAHAFFTAPGPPGYSCNSSGGAIYEKTSPLSAISFPTGTGTAVITDADSPYLHNVSASKQTVNATTGIVVLATNLSTSYYWHAFETLAPAPPPSPPTAGFPAAPTTGTAPLSVSFLDQSTGSPTAWQWSFGDGSGSSSQNPTHIFSAAGAYDVSLSVSNSLGSSTVSRTSYITAVKPPPDFSVSTSPTSTTVVRGGTATFHGDSHAQQRLHGPGRPDSVWGAGREHGDAGTELGRRADHQRGHAQRRQHPDHHDRHLHRHGHSQQRRARAQRLRHVPGEGDCR